MIDAWHIVAFVVGGLVFRYFEQIIEIIKYLRKDINKAKRGVQRG